MMLIGYGVFARILRTAWASALLVTDYLGDARASIRGTSNRQTPTLFCNFSRKFFEPTRLGSYWLYYKRSMATVKYDVSDADYLAISFECPKCGKKNVIEGIEIPNVEENMHFTHHCQNKGCNAKYLIEMRDKLEYGEVEVPNLPNDGCLKVEGILYEFYHNIDLDLIRYIDNRLEIKDLLEAVSGMEEKYRNTIYKSLYVKLISTMDFFLSSMVKREMNNSDDYKIKYAIYKYSSNAHNLNRFYRNHIKRESFQNIDNVVKFLSAVFNIHINADEYSSLREAVRKRNAIIHKNSFEDRKKGKTYDISEEDILTLKSEIDRFTQEVRECFDGQLDEKMVANNNNNKKK